MFAGAELSVAVIAIVLGATVFTGGAETVAAKLPAASATVLPNDAAADRDRSPGREAGPGDRDRAAGHEAGALDGDHGRGAPAGATSAAATPAAAAIRSFILFTSLNEMTLSDAPARRRRPPPYPRGEPVNPGVRGEAVPIRPRRHGRPRLSSGA